MWRIGSDGVNPGQHRQRKSKTTADGRGILISVGGGYSGRSRSDAGRRRDREGEVRKGWEDIVSD